MVRYPWANTILLILLIVQLLTGIGGLIAGSAVFGIGWGIAGFCPGGALPALGTFYPDVLVFVAAMLAGMVGARWLLNRPGGRAQKTSSIPS